MIRITVEYFAQLREQAGLASEVIETQTTDIAVFYSEVASQHGFKLSQDDLKAAVNDEFVSWNYQLVDGDRLVFIPPVAGG